MPAGLARARETVNTAAAVALMPEPDLTVSEWADRYRILDGMSAEPGPWRTARAPYLKEIMDKMSSRDPTTRVVVMKGSQLGFSEAALNVIGYIIHHAPGPIISVWPTIDLARRHSKQRVAAMIAACDELKSRVSESRSRDGENTVLQKIFPSGILILAGSNSSAGLRSTAARYLICDETDAFAHDAGGEGDPVSLAEKRTVTFRANRKILSISSPTIDGVSRIQEQFELSDKRYYMVPCPFCNHEQRIIWDRIKWESGEPETAALECEGCGERVEEHHKTWMLANGKWVATEESETAGYHISGLYSPLGWLSWADAAKEFLAAKKNPLKLQVWVNTVLGEVWSAEHETGNPDVLAARREAYCPSEGDPLPEGVLILTAGVDVQDDRLEIEIMGWGRGYESWGIDHRTFRCESGADPNHSAVWDALCLSISREWKRADGAKLRLAAICVDTGGHFTDAAYRFCIDNKYRKVFAIKGVGGAGRPIVGKPSRSNRYKMQLWPVGVDTAKDVVAARLRVSSFGPDYCHFPRDYTDDFFKQLCAERKIARLHKGFRRFEWHKTGPNEAFDMRVYATAALSLIGVDINAFADLCEKRKDAAENDETAPTKQNAKAKKPRRRDSWVSDWRQ